MQTLQIKQLSPNATLPTRNFHIDSGLDIYAAEDVMVRNNETVVVSTGIAINIPKGYEGTIRPRSGKTSKTALRVQIGTIDAGYINEIGVICDCHHKEPYVRIEKGERIAQLVLQRVELPQLEIVDHFHKNSDRGLSGFGSSDKEVEE